ncbi:MAG: hypothetical protein GY737_32040 [Desulfobacteraceae bacterium]|nr:hypothetical protein [Desulfobacteraceae bacterium]
MDTQVVKHKTYSRKIWLISSGWKSSMDLGNIFPGLETDSVREYRISDLANYMINPNPIKVNNRLIGCEILHRRSGWQAVKQKMSSLFSKEKSKDPARAADQGDILISGLIPGSSSSAATKELNAHISRVYDQLIPFDTMVQKISSLDKAAVLEINGICEDLEGNRSFMRIAGPVEDKINFITHNLSKDIQVLVEKAHFNEGLFEMRAFDFKGYDPDNQHRLVKFIQNGKPMLCTITHDNRVNYVLEDVELITYLQLFELALKGNDPLKELLFHYCEGTALPLKILFNQEIKTDYSKANLPLLYRRMEESGTMGPREKKLISRVLNQKQFGLSLNYIPQQGEFNDRVITSIFVMQDLKALDPIKSLAPQLYWTINSSAAISEAGTFYLIDSIRGVRDE